MRVHLAAQGLCFQGRCFFFESFLPPFPIGHEGEASTGQQEHRSTAGGPHAVPVLIGTQFFDRAFILQLHQFAGIPQTVRQLLFLKIEKQVALGDLAFGGLIKDPIADIGGTLQEFNCLHTTALAFVGQIKAFTTTLFRRRRLGGYGQVQSLITESQRAVIPAPGDLQLAQFSQRPCLSGCFTRISGDPEHLVEDAIGIIGAPKQAIDFAQGRHRISHFGM